MEVDPSVYLPIAADIAFGLKDALAKSAVVVPHPLQGEWKGLFEPFQDAAGVRSYAAFMKAAQCVSIDVGDDQVEITPQRNLGPKEGFEPIADAAVLFPVEDELGAASALLQFLS
ncbi:hypothetical protein PIB19_04610 [Sphingomonas sp. 7/4-4]|uniref:hypothetical protein n=1 Tax=Sphingomonas sp. 7/4-4 TaxID=3018446 RepID=UPI0022F3AC5C|nr:hypothetical protein [Sphingomonas sp. 7/4-4]WBY08728.1 hypothetical protein PIB19_04610 [Sphingomonas sp. 7/4-4]